MKIKDRNYRSFAACSLILGVVGMCAGMIIQMVLDWREAGPLPALLPLLVGALPGLFYPLLYKIGIVDGYYNYTDDELGALEEFRKDLQ